MRMAGGMDRVPHRSTSLAERTRGRRPAPEAEPTAPPPSGDPDPAPAAAPVPSPRPQRHCWVVDGASPYVRAPGLLVEWRQLDGSWQGRVAYVVGADEEATLVEAWLPASQLVRAFPA